MLNLKRNLTLLLLLQLMRLIIKRFLKFLNAKDLLLLDNIVLLAEIENLDFSVICVVII